MAATLTVSYTPQYQGAHRICFRTTQTAYCCYLDQSLSVIGVPKTTEIDLTEFESCLVNLPAEFGCITYALDGYVQPACEASDSSVNRVTFNVAYPSPIPCTPYEVLCVESGIGEIEIINPGYGWPVGVVPTVTVNTSGSGFGFASTVTMLCLPGDSFCSIASIFVDNPGEEYFYLNELSVDVSPLPSCVSNELLINGDFDDALLNWNVIPPVDGWLLTPGLVPYYNIPVYSSTGGTIEQSVLTPGRTYLIDFEKVTIEARSGTVRFIVTAGLFSITGTASNQYMITKNSGDPDFDGPLSITLTCFGSSVFSIYADSITTDPLNTARLTAVSVVELCDIVDPELVASLDDCATFTISNCDGSNNPTEYQIQGTAPYAINVCSGGTGPVGIKYIITPNPELIPGNICFNLGTEAVGLYTCSISPAGTYNGKDYYIMVAPDCVTPYDAQIAPNVWTVWYSTGNGYVNQWVLSEGLDQYLYVQDYLPVSSSPNFPLGNWVIGPEAGAIELLSTDTNCQVSCCNCVKYDVINTELSGTPIQFYYTDCVNQTITLSALDSQDTTQVCAVRSSVWPSDPNNNQYFEYILSSTQDC